MPAERKSLRGRTRSKSRGQRGARYRLTNTEAGCSAENPATAPHPSGSRFLNSLSPSKSILWSNETANGQSLEKTSVWGAVFSFFFPTTCIPKENQVVKPCNRLRDFNESECLRNKCCYSSVKTSNFTCFAPLKDKPTQMFRMFGFVVISIISLGCLPIYCCSFCRRRWANPLRRKVSRLLKGLKKQRSKLKRDAEMLGAEMDEEGLDDEKEETKALFSH
uniref:Fragile X mental retardation 1 neighbor protein n=1 Tax=Camelus bactrianus TaxID=9837 RepID=A0A9W3G9E3_CAMBA|nr:fragile X mental retardation 1 neighbor protein [Camelus bactrianus]